MTKTYKPELTEAQMNAVRRILEGYLKSTEKPVLVYPQKDEERWGDPAAAAARGLLNTKRKYASEALDAIKKELAKK